MPRYLSFYLVGAICFVFGIWVGLYDAAHEPLPAGWKIISDDTGQSPNPAP